MNKTSEKLQFEAIDKKLCTYMQVHAIPDEKEPIHYRETKWIKKMAESYAESMGMTLTDATRWLWRRVLSHNNLLPVQVEKCERCDPRPIPPPIKRTLTKQERGENISYKANQIVSKLSDEQCHAIAMGNYESIRG
jgi:hypothetical protein